MPTQQAATPEWVTPPMDQTGLLTRPSATPLMALMVPLKQISGGRLITAMAIVTPTSVTRLTALTAVPTPTLVARLTDPTDQAAPVLAGLPTATNHHLGGQCFHQPDRLSPRAETYAQSGMPFKVFNAIVIFTSSSSRD